MNETTDNLESAIQDAYWDGMTEAEIVAAVREFFRARSGSVRL